MTSIEAIKTHIQQLITTSEAIEYKSEYMTGFEDGLQMALTWVKYIDAHPHDSEWFEVHPKDNAHV